MKCNQKGIDLIKSFEGCRLEAYQDQVGIWTIGYGHTGDDVYEGKTISQEEADAILEKDIEAVAERVTELLRIRPQANQFSALCSFAFNLGTGTLSRSSLLSLFNSGDVQSTAAEFGKWCHAGGKEVPGLVRRREAERELFLTPDDQC